MNSIFFSFALVLWLAATPVAALAEKADRNRPMNVEADALKHDDLKQLSIFTGNVVVTKGTIAMRGARLEVRTDADGYQYCTLIAAPGQRAFFRQKREGVDEYIEGEGEIIVYDSKVDDVRFSKRAELRRLRGAVVADEISGNLIVYSNLSDLFTVDSVPGTGTGTASAPAGGRVRAMLTPARKPDASSPVSPGDAPAATPLRSATSLGGARP